MTFTFPAGGFFPGGTTRKVPAGQNAEPYQVTAMLASKDLLGKPGLMSASVNLEEVTLFS